MTEAQYQGKLQELDEVEQKGRESLAEAESLLEACLTTEAAYIPAREARQKAIHGLQLLRETRAFFVWTREQELQGRPAAELTFDNFVRETGTLLVTDKPVSGSNQIQ